MLILSTFLLLCSVSESWQWQSCFNQPCGPGSSFTTCAWGTYQCAANEFCEVTTHRFTDQSQAPSVYLECRPNFVLEDCLAEQAKNDPSCDPTDHSQRCHWCCETEICMTALANGIFPTGATVQHFGSTTQAPQTPPAGGCVDQYHGDCSVDFPGLCGDAEIRILCAKTCQVCSGSAVQSTPGAQMTTGSDWGTPSGGCVDKYHGDCSVDFPGLCGDAEIQMLCAKTCQVCSGSAVQSTPGAQMTTGSAWGTPSGGCVDKYHGDCSMDFPGLCGDAEIQMLCAKTCQVCSGSAVQSTPGAQMTTGSAWGTPSGVCEDKYLGDCSVDFPGLCGDADVQILCAKTCRVCGGSAVQSTPGAQMTTGSDWGTPSGGCVDQYHGDCSVDFPGLCGDAEIQMLCAKTCQVCTSSAAQSTPGAQMSTGSAWGTPSGGCVDQYHGDCSVDFPGLCGDAEIQMLCAKTCQVCGDSAVQTTRGLHLITGSDLGGCVDKYHGDCSVDFPGLCGDAEIQMLCARTCQVC